MRGLVYVSFEEVRGVVIWRGSLVGGRARNIPCAGWNDVDNEEEMMT